MGGGRRPGTGLGPPVLMTPLDSVRMDLADGWFVCGRLHDTVDEEWRYVVAILGQKRLLHPSWAQVGGVDGVKRMRGTKSGGQELSPEHVHVI